MLSYFTKNLSAVVLESPPKIHSSLVHTRTYNLILRTQKNTASHRFMIANYFLIFKFKPPMCLS